MISRLIISNVFIAVFNMMNARPNTNIQVVSRYFKENGFFPNHPLLPVLLYKNVFDKNNSDLATVIENVLNRNKWGDSWRNGIYNFHHYHSTSHEALGIYEGWADVQLGGPGNEPVRIEKGDLMVLPAGTVHKRIDSGNGFAVVGAYPDGRKYDMNYGKENELEKAKWNIAEVPLPKHDPVSGENGYLFTQWK